MSVAAAIPAKTKATLQRLYPVNRFTVLEVEECPDNDIETEMADLIAEETLPVQSETKRRKTKTSLIGGCGRKSAEVPDKNADDLSTPDEPLPTETLTKSTFPR